MPETREVTVYKVQELEGKAKARALEWLAEGNTLDPDWWSDSVLEDARRIAALFGLDIDKEQPNRPGRDGIAWSGFWSQGDGASVTGSYHYVRMGAQAVKQYALQDTELHRIVDALTAVQKRHGYRLTASITRDSYAHYSHERSVNVEVWKGDREANEYTTEALADVLRDFMRWIYKQLEKEYEYQTSEQACIESADANEYRFDQHGEPIHHLTERPA